MKRGLGWLAGAMLVCAGVADAATTTVESSFVNRFDTDGSQAVPFAFDPFDGDPDALTAVLFQLDSTLVAGQPFSYFETALTISYDDGGSFVLLVGQTISPPLGNDPDPLVTAFDISREMLAEGASPDIFTGGPVRFLAEVLVFERSSAGVWFAGDDPSSGGGGIGAPLDFGSVTLTYRYEEPDLPLGPNPPGGGMPTVPLPGGLPVLAGGVALLGALRRRGGARAHGVPHGQ
jgi:hypothetical protein